MNLKKGLLVILVYFYSSDVCGCTTSMAYDIYAPSNEAATTASPIILLHDFLESKKTWTQVAQPLADKTGKLVYAVDLRNHGDSPWTEEFNISVITEDLEDFIKSKNISEAILVGHSMGGRLAQTVALKQSDKVEKLIIEEMSTANVSTAVHPAIVGLQIRLLKHAFSIIPNDTDEETALNIIKEFLEFRTPKFLLTCNSIDMSPIYISNGSANYRANVPVLEEKFYSGALDENLTGIYERNTLFIYGTSSDVKVDNDELIKDYFPKAQLLGFKGGNHFIHQSYPEDFVRETARFITGVINP
ncbi:protein ABHD11-like [Uloborus diversus]|uniref:protein ABHD11-like n=1 Tax=Uloborus diversus TaxID=327109 RepID=UPI00240A13D6|nr:protein ABHD11-like [Uloborus diversus]